MHEEPNRYCPICKYPLVPTKGLDYRKENGQLFRVFDCPNCTTQIWVAPFKGYCEGRR